MTKLTAGDVAPDFTLMDHTGSPVKLSDLQGQKVILYFYPAAMTPGCTTQACDFRDSLSSLKSAGYTVLGVSKDDVPTLMKFVKKENANFQMLSDEDLSVQKAYGAWGEKSLYGVKTVGSIRSTFVIDAKGKISHAMYNVKATGHVAALRKKLGVD